MRNPLFATAAALFFAGALVAAQSAPATPRTADGKVDLNGIWGVTAPPPAAKPGESVRWLLPLKGVNPERGMSSRVWIDGRSKDAPQRRTSPSTSPNCSRR